MVHKAERTPPQALRPLGEVFPGETKNLAGLMKAARKVAGVQYLLDRAQAGYNSQLELTRPPELPEGYVFARQLGGTCLLALNREVDGLTGWEGFRATIPEDHPSYGKYFIGETLAYLPMSESSLVHPGFTQESQEPLIGIDGLQPDSATPLDTRLLLRQDELGSVLVAPLECIPPGQRFMANTD